MTIDELEAYFKGLQLPQSVELNKGVKITDVKKFVASHIAVLKSYGLKPISKPFYDRLMQLKNME